jgi:Fe-S oxidoreductase
MFAEDYRELKIDPPRRTERVGARCFLFEKFVDDLLAREPDALHFKNGQPRNNRGSRSLSESQDRQINVAIHAHCHARSIMNPAFMTRLVERLPGRKAKLLDTGCCGMAGAFGALAEKYELSIQVAADLLKKIDKQHPDVLVASGTSCRHQIVDLTTARPKHMAELLADAIA